MPGFLTHYLAGEAVLAQSANAFAEKIVPEYSQIFNLGAQGADIFFYYAPGFLRGRSRNVGSVIHHADFGLFFMEMARRARHEVVFAYLAGFLVHYAVDVAAHPFVNACTQDEGASSMQKSAAHRHFETVTDVLMLQRLRGQKPADLRQSKIIAAPQEHKRVAAVVFAEAVQKIYARALLPQDVYHAMGHMAALTRLLESPTGRRKRAAAFIEDKLVDARIVSAMVHMQEVTDERDYLNLSRVAWNAETTRSESFPELFDKAVAHAAELINALDAYRRGELPRRGLADVIGNYSLSTGEPCS